MSMSLIPAHPGTRPNGIPPSEDEAEPRNFNSRRHKTAADNTTVGVCFARPMQTEKQNDMEKTFGNDPT